MPNIRQIKYSISDLCNSVQHIVNVLESYNQDIKREVNYNDLPEVDVSYLKDSGNLCYRILDNLKVQITILEQAEREAVDREEQLEMKKKKGKEDREKKSNVKK